MKNLLLALCFFLLMTAQSFAALVNINNADLATLQTLPGIGNSKAQAIIDYRSEHGSFKSVDELTQVKGIGDKVLDKIRDMVEAK